MEQQVFYRCLAFFDGDEGDKISNLVMNVLVEENAPYALLSLLVKHDPLDFSLDSVSETSFTLDEDGAFNYDEKIEYGPYTLAWDTGRRGGDCMVLEKRYIISSALKPDDEPKQVAA